MGRHSQPERTFSWRKAMRFSRVEIALWAAAVFLFAVGLAVFLNRLSAADKLIREGRCDVTAAVVGVPDSYDRRFARRVTVAFLVDGRPYEGTLHYDAPRLPLHSQISLCTSRDDPGVFATTVHGSLGTSTGIWLSMLIGGGAGSVAFAALVVLASSHQWQFAEGEQP